MLLEIITIGCSNLNTYITSGINFAHKSMIKETEIRYIIYFVVVQLKKNYKCFKNNFMLFTSYDVSKTLAFNLILNIFMDSFIICLYITLLLNIIRICHNRGHQ